jgi:hypothetical protein
VRHFVPLVHCEQVGCTSQEAQGIRQPMEQQTGTLQAMEMLDGTWRLVYTSNSELMAVLALSQLPLVSVLDIDQIINSLSNEVINSMTVSLPGSSTSVSVRAALSVQSPKRVGLRFESGKISTPNLVADIEIPRTTNVMGQVVDLTALRSAVQPLLNSSRGFIEQVRPGDRAPQPLRPHTTTPPAWSQHQHSAPSCAPWALALCDVPWRFLPRRPQCQAGTARARPQGTSRPGYNGRPLHAGG